SRPASPGTSTRRRGSSCSPPPSSRHGARAAVPAAATVRIRPNSGHLEAWSVPWVLMHLVAETARHAGHADIVREGVDGATVFPLMAAAEGWPATPWLQP